MKITVKELSKGLTNQYINEGRETDVLSGPTHPLPKEITQKNRYTNSKIRKKDHTALHTNTNPLDSCENSPDNKVLILHAWCDTGWLLSLYHFTYFIY